MKKNYIFTNDDGEVMGTVEAESREEAIELYDLSDHYMLTDEEEI